MNNRRSNNSVLFLATLGVYLGLVLAGATPQVLANAAMTRQFNVKDEIEVSDNLDKNPDGLNSSPAYEIDIFSDAVAGLVRDLNQLSKKKQFSWNKTNHFTVKDLSFCESDNTPSYLGSGETSNQSRKAFENAAIRIGREYFRTSSNLGIGGYYDGWPIGASFDLTTLSDSLTLKIKFTTKNTSSATTLLQEIDRNINEFVAVDSDRKIVLETTKSKASDNSVILIIHLPRAGLDSLLATSAK